MTTPSGKDPAQAVEIRRSGDRGESRNGWLHSRFSFSFADYYDPDQMGFGPLRVINEDRVAPASGFQPHSHQNMEIVTIVLQGALSHEDSTGGQGVLRAGEVQTMTAGTGVVHSEMNASPDEPVHFLQIWIIPERRGLHPGYTQRRIVPEDAKLAPGRFVPVASGRGEPDALPIHQDASIRIGAFEAGGSSKQSVGSGRRAYVHFIDGAGSVNGAALEGGDAVKLVDPGAVTIAARTPARVLFFDLP